MIIYTLLRRLYTEGRNLRRINIKEEFHTADWRDRKKTPKFCFYQQPSKKLKYKMPDLHLILFFFFFVIRVFFFLCKRFFFSCQQLYRFRFFIRSCCVYFSLFNSSSTLDLVYTFSSTKNFNMYDWKTPVFQLKKNNCYSVDFWIVKKKKKLHISYSCQDLYSEI